MDTKKIIIKEKFEMPMVELVVFDCEDVITSSGEGGGFEGEWDDKWS